MVDLSISTGALDTLLCDESDDHQHGLPSIENLTTPGSVFNSCCPHLLGDGHQFRCWPLSKAVDSYLDE